LGLAFGDERADALSEWRDHPLWLYLIGGAETSEDTEEGDAPWCLAVADRVCCHQRGPRLGRRAPVGVWGARPPRAAPAPADRDASARADEIDPGVGKYLARFDEIIDRSRRRYNQIGLGAFLDLHRQYGARLETDNYLVAAGALEHWNKLFQHFAHRGGSNNAD